MMRICAAALTLCLLPSSALARDLTIATWNLGWHIDKSTAATWIAKCNSMFAKDTNTGVWKPSPTGSGIPGWQVNFREEVEWDWTKFPVCDVYKDRNFDTVPVTVGAYDKRQQQLNDFLQNTLPADIYAFQEVSGEKAVREALPNGGDGYEVCTFSDFKVQRLAIACRQIGMCVWPTTASAFKITGTCDRFRFDGGGLGLGKLGCVSGPAIGFKITGTGSLIPL